MSLTKNSPFQNFVDLVLAKGACGAGVDWSELINMQSPTFGEAMDKYLNDVKAKEGWAIWCIKMIYKELDKEMRINFIKKIITPMRAFKLYITEKNLTDEEDILLKEKFHNKLPRAELELALGRIKREKVNAND